MPERVAVGELKVDGLNPNRMSVRQLAALKESMRRWHFISPIITNKDLLVADGEQRLAAAKELGMKEVSVIRLPVEDVDRRLLRQVLNKLRGEHELLADAMEFDKILQAGHEQDLKQLLLMSDDKIEKYVNLLKGESNPDNLFESIYEIAISCGSEAEQRETFEKLKGMGYKCRVLML